MLHAVAFVAVATAGTVSAGRARVCMTSIARPGDHLILVNAETHAQSWCVVRRGAADLIDVSDVVRGELGFVNRAQVRVYLDIGPTAQPRRMPLPVYVLPRS